MCLQQTVAGYKRSTRSSMGISPTSKRQTELSRALTMKHYTLLSLLLALGCVHVRGMPLAQGGVEQGSCADASAVGAAILALTKINHDRLEGYVFALHRLSNVHTTKHGDTGTVFYLTLDVVETNCSVHSKMDWKACEARPTTNTPVYGQCKVAIYIDKVNRVVRLYKYDCVVRPVSATKVQMVCPDCPARIGMDHAKVQTALTLSLEKFNSESGLPHRFALLKVERVTSGMAMSMYYNVEYSIQETTCTNTSAATDKCPPMSCEFAHKGFCKASLFYSPSNQAAVSVDCEIYEPEAAEAEKQHHVLGGETDHSHKDTHAHSHDHDGVHAADGAHTHDHDHDHTHTHDNTSDHDHTHDKTNVHAHTHDNTSDHHHTHDHEAGSSHRHGHAHSHDHGHNHDHVHTHHAKAHNHSTDSPHHHHDYKHADTVHTHEHDHELALDHDHKHGHLHVHEHHHHHHDHVHEATAHDHPEGTVKYLPAMDAAATLPAFSVIPGSEVVVTLSLKPDPQIPGQAEPTILAFPTVVSATCPPAAAGDTLVEQVFAEDPLFKPAA